MYNMLLNQELPLSKKVRKQSFFTCHRCKTINKINKSDAIIQDNLIIGSLISTLVMINELLSFVSSKDLKTFNKNMLKIILINFCSCIFYYVPNYMIRVRGIHVLHKLEKTFNYLEIIILACLTLQTLLQAAYVIFKLPDRYSVKLEDSPNKLIFVLLPAMIIHAVGFYFKLKYYNQFNRQNKSSITNSVSL